MLIFFNCIYFFILLMLHINHKSIEIVIILFLFIYFCLYIFRQFQERNKSVGTDEREYRVLARSKVSKWRGRKEGLRTACNCNCYLKTLGEKVNLWKNKIILLPLCVHKGRSSPGRGSL